MVGGGTSSRALVCTDQLSFFIVTPACFGDGTTRFDAEYQGMCISLHRFPLLVLSTHLLLGTVAKFQGPFHTSHSFAVQFTIKHQTGTSTQRIMWSTLFFMRSDDGNRKVTLA